jgi:hypothetical protein
MPPGSVSVVPSWRRIFVVAPLAAAKPMRALVLGFQNFGIFLSILSQIFYELDRFALLAAGVAH